MPTATRCTCIISNRHWVVPTNSAGMKRTLQGFVKEAAAASRDGVPADSLPSFGVLAVKEVSVLDAVVTFLEALDDDGFEELSAFQNEHWREFLGASLSEDEVKCCAEVSAGRQALAEAAVLKPAVFKFEETGLPGSQQPPSAPLNSAATPYLVDGGSGSVSVSSDRRRRVSPCRRRALERYQTLHREFGALLERQIETVVKDAGYTMLQFYERVRSELGTIAEQEAAVQRALAINKEEAEAGDRRGGKRRRTERAPRAPDVAKMCQDEDEGVSGLLCYVNQASDLVGFVDSMRFHAMEMGQAEAAGLLQDPPRCARCSRRPCFDPWHQPDKRGALGKWERRRALRMAHAPRAVTLWG